jgi:hypothetical protein
MQARYGCAWSFLMFAVLAVSCAEDAEEDPFLALSVEDRGCVEGCKAAGNHWGECTYNQSCYGFNTQGGLEGLELIGQQTCSDSQNCCCLQECLAPGTRLYGSCGICCSGKCKRPPAGADGPSKCY